MIRFMLAFFVVTLFVSCGEDQSEIDEALIQEYITENGLTTEKGLEGLHIIVTEPGNDERPTINSDVEMCYEGYLLDGTVFDGTYVNGQCNESLTFALSRLIRGWQIGIPQFGKGGKGTLIIPSALAYGSTGAGSIQPNTVIAFDIHVIDF